MLLWLVTINARSDRVVCPLQKGKVSAVADLGGSILTGIDGNPLAVIAKQLHIPLHVIDEANVPLYQDNGQQAHTLLDQEVSLFRTLSLCTSSISIAGSHDHGVTNSSPSCHSNNRAHVFDTTALAIPNLHIQAAIYASN